MRTGLRERRRIGVQRSQGAYTSLKLTGPSRCNRRVNLRFNNGTNSFSGSDYQVYLGADLADGEWHRVQANLQDIITDLTPGVNYTYCYGLSVWTSRAWIDDIRLSDSITVEHNTLGGGSIAHILRNRTYNVSGTLPTATDRWFHYDQVGSLIAKTDSNGNSIVDTDYQDAFGNVTSGWTSGEWNDSYAGRDGWHHNTKEFGGDSGLVYMYQRWYMPELGIFVSQAPYPEDIEHQYTFAESSPVFLTDPRGEMILIPILPSDLPENPVDLDCVRRAATTAQRAADSSGLPGMHGGQQDAYRHCVWMCLASKTCGNLSDWIAGTGHEFFSNGGVPMYSTPDESMMDLHNNEEGRKLGQECGSNCDQGCRSKLANGELVTLPWGL